VFEKNAKFDGYAGRTLQIYIQISESIGCREICGLFCEHKLCKAIELSNPVCLGFHVDLIPFSLLIDNHTQPYLDQKLVEWRSMNRYELCKQMPNVILALDHLMTFVRAVLI
jgi:hypothetical protein